MDCDSNPKGDGQQARISSLQPAELREAIASRRSREAKSKLGGELNRAQLSEHQIGIARIEFGYALLGACGEVHQR